MTKKFFAPLVATVLLLLSTGCGVIDYFYLPPPEDTAQELFELGNEAMQEKDYYTAIDMYTKLKDRYPFSPFTPQAELALGDAYYLNEDFSDAVVAYQEFEALHPRHDDMPYVLYQVGLASYKSFTSIDRPQQVVAEGLQYLYRLRETYPTSQYAEPAGELVLKCRRILAEREVFVGDFYMRTERFGAAWKRYQFVVDNFPDITDAASYAKKQGDVAYLKQQKASSQRALDESEGSWKDWFDWL